jgi:hypothetical protein
MARMYGKVVGGPGSGHKVAFDLSKGGQDQFDLLLAISKETAYGKTSLSKVIQKVF